MTSEEMTELTRTINEIQDTLFFLRKKNNSREIYNLVSCMFLSFEKKLLKEILSGMKSGDSYDFILKNSEANSLFQKFLKENNITEEELSWIELLKKKEVILNTNIKYNPCLNIEDLSHIIILPEDDLDDKISKMKLICLYDKIMNQ